ncbi:MAG: NADH-quinone oxidoreductase subunit G, partial [Gammaproteobacteria bacterium]
VNLEGRWQSFEETVAPPGDARAAWRVLRVLGNYLELEGFEFSSCADITNTVRGLHQDGAVQEGPWFVPAGLNGTSTGPVQRIGDVPAYAVDPMVRRAQALQETPDAVAGAIRINSKTAARLGLANCAQAVAVQGEARQSLPLVVDERVADGAALLHSAVPECIGLGPAFGVLTIEMGDG